MSGSRFHFGEAEARNAGTLIDLALAEDLGQVGDITTTATIPSQARGRAHFVARAPGVLAGMPVVERLVHQFQLGSGWTSTAPTVIGWKRGSCSRTSPARCARSWRWNGRR